MEEWGINEEERENETAGPGVEADAETIPAQGHVLSRWEYERSWLNFFSLFLKFKKLSLHAFVSFRALGTLKTMVPKKSLSVCFFVCQFHPNNSLIMWEYDRSWLNFGALISRDLKGCYMKLPFLYITIDWRVWTFNLNQPIKIK